MKRTGLLTAILLMASLFPVMAQTQGPKTKVIAHRGAWKNTGAPQNSIASLQEAIKLGCFGSEFDVHLSADSVLVLSHDHVIQGVDIEKATAAQLAAVKLSNGESLPTLEAFLKEGLKQSKTRLVLEIKASKVSKERSLALTTKAVQMVKALKGQALVDYISFDYDVCKRVKALDPSAKVAYLNGEKSPEQLAEDGLYGLDYHQSVLKKNENWIKEAQQKNLTVNTWTINQREMMDWMLERNVDFITTDEPEQLLNILKSGR
ncbi:glycerophosphodiester phosphodiesterase [Tellurirhabdus bombi]|uniref:glycerophosphodiester phosphodiesterase n=1 Tax=Tellurirhabdus bombi TaxID=2907205 RepID=UPI001F3D50D3|nr:glycerophosphodiester phosphodiesterase family protein [Tellurirhabdus bombi]